MVLRNRNIISAFLETLSHGWWSACVPHWWIPMVFKWYNSIYLYSGERYPNGGQDMLLQNTAPWHIEYFKLKEFEKMAESDLLSDPSLYDPETGHKTLMWKVPSLHPEEKEHPYLWKQRGTENNQNKLSLISFSQFTHFTSHSPTYCISP